MIIAISGKLGSGKDLTGEIIRYLISKDTHALHPDSVFNPNNIQYTESNWKIKKFAGKLKEIVALLTGCTAQDLESQDFKNKQLSEDWWYVMNGSGRPVHADTFIGDPVFDGNPQRFLKTYTYREMLQKVGTDAMRNKIHENIWVNALFADYKENVNYTIPGMDTFAPLYKYPDWIITDCRFPNELVAVEKQDGITIRVKRTQFHTVDSFKISEHSSETALDDAEFDFVIDNDGSIDDLIVKVREILVECKILKNI